MEDTRLTEDANELTNRIKQNPIKYYYDLLDFSEKYAVGSDSLKEEIILLGNKMFDQLEFQDYYRISDEFKDSLTEESILLINKIKKHSIENNNEASDNYYEIAEDRLLQSIPADTLIFKGENIQKSYGKDRYFDYGNLNLKLGQITCLIGENGAGKTTLLRIIAGDLRIDAGDLSYPLFTRKKNDWVSIKKSVAFVQQKIPDWSSQYTVREFLHFTASIKGLHGTENLKYVDYILNRLSLKDYEDYTWRELSGGFKLRFEIARQLIWRPRLLILDEPLANLDMKAQQSLLIDLKNLCRSVNNSMSIIISSQNLDIEKISDNILYLKDGKVFYFGATQLIGQDRKYNCFELELDCRLFDLQDALYELPIRNIKHTSTGFFVFTDRSIAGSEIIERLLKAGLEPKLYRDLSHSIRLQFEL